MKPSTILIALATALPASALPSAEANELVEKRTFLPYPTCGQVWDYCQQHGKKAWCKGSGGGYSDCTGKLQSYKDKPWTSVCPSGKGYFCPNGLNINILGLFIMCLDLDVFLVKGGLGGGLLGGWKE